MSALAVATNSPFDVVHDFAYHRDDFQALSALVYADAGIVMPEGKAMLIYSRLTKYLRERAVATFAEYIGILNSDPQERRRAISALTTNHTKFFRENHHFEHFARDVRLQMVRRALGGGRVRMWSAGCSSGEEVYSLGMTLLGEEQASGRRIAGSDIALLATDLADHVLETGRAATYPSIGTAEMPARLKQNWARAEGVNIVISDAVRDLVRFRQLNLLGNWPLTGMFDVIFCRNVMIYFDEPTKKKLLDRLCAKLQPGGYLYIGHSERLVGPAVRHCDPVGPTIYRKHGA
ncbi:MAG: protein-glutamate O-methyltransferase CheR [Alphaproteobacteria bacterium]|nr:protein-glutamate O-methyltransferase CheR [Alphaproteobacteria bacterium]